MIELYLLRHAQTEYNAVSKYIGGRSNFLCLSELGLMQAKRRGEYFKSNQIAFDKVFCSIAQRTRETVTMISDVYPICDSEIVYSEQIQELSQGDWEGKERDRYFTKEVLEELNRTVPHFKAPNGESHKEVEERMVSFVQHNILDKYKEGKFLIVGHGNAFRCLLQGVIGINPYNTYKLGIDNVSLTKLRYDEKKGWFLDYMNQII